MKTMLLQSSERHTLTGVRNIATKPVYICSSHADLLLQAAAACGLDQSSAGFDRASNRQTAETSNKYVQLATSRLLSASCVRQQILSIKQKQALLGTDNGTADAPAQGDGITEHVERQVQNAEDSSGLASSSANSDQGGADLSTAHVPDQQMNQGTEQSAQDIEEDKQIADAVMARLLAKR